MRIAVLNHGHIQNDSRIIKQVRSLEEMGHDIHVIALKSKDGSVTAPKVPFKSPVTLLARDRAAAVRHVATGPLGRLWRVNRGLRDRIGKPAHAILSLVLVILPLVAAFLLADDTRAALAGSLRGGLAFLSLVLLTFGATLFLIFCRNRSRRKGVEGSLASQLATKKGAQASGVFLGAFLLFCIGTYGGTQQPVNIGEFLVLMCGVALSALLADFLTASLPYLSPVMATSPQTGRQVNVAFPTFLALQEILPIRDGVLKAAADTGAFDVIHAHDLQALAASAGIASDMGATLVWDAHELYEDMAGLEETVSALRSKTIRDASASVDRFITISEPMAEFYAENYPALPPAVVVMNATDDADPVADDGRLRQAAGVPEGQKILLFQGGLSKDRGLVQLVDSVPTLSPDWVLVFMSSGMLEADLKVRAAGINADAGSTRIVFLPPVPNRELAHWTAGADLGIIPYENTCKNHWYCSPNKLWEYPRAGVPFLAPRLSLIEQVVSEYDSGFLMPVDFDASTISDAINAITDEALAEKRKGGFRFVAENGWNIFADRLRAVYREIETDRAG